MRTYIYTVEPPNKGHLGTRASVLYSEVSFIRSVLYRRFHCICIYMYMYVGINNPGSLHIVHGISTTEWDIRFARNKDINYKHSICNSPHQALGSRNPSPDKHEEGIRSAPELLECG